MKNFYFATVLFCLLIVSSIVYAGNNPIIQSPYTTNTTANANLYVSNIVLQVITDTNRLIVYNGGGITNLQSTNIVGLGTVAYSNSLAFVGTNAFVTTNALFQATLTGLQTSSNFVTSATLDTATNTTWMTASNYTSGVSNYARAGLIQLTNINNSLGTAAYSNSTAFVDVNAWASSNALFQATLTGLQTSSNFVTATVTNGLLAATNGTAYNTITINPVYVYAYATVSSEGSAYGVFDGTYSFAYVNAYGYQVATNSNGVSLSWDSNSQYGGYWVFNLLSGVKVYYDGSNWRFSDTGQPAPGIVFTLPLTTYTPLRTLSYGNLLATGTNFGNYGYITNTITAGYFAGNGGGLMNLQSTNITGGNLTITGTNTASYFVGNAGGLYANGGTIEITNDAVISFGDGNTDGYALFKGGTANFDGGNALFYNSGYAEFGVNSYAAFNNGAEARFNGGGSAKFQSGSAAYFNNSTAYFNNGSALFNGGGIEFDNGAGAFFNSGTTLSVAPGVLVGAGGGLTNLQATNIVGLGTAAYSNSSAFVGTNEWAATNALKANLANLTIAATNSGAYVAATNGTMFGTPKIAGGLQVGSYIGQSFQVSAELLNNGSIQWGSGQGQLGNDGSIVWGGLNGELTAGGGVIGTFAEISGTNTASYFSGNGGGLTNLQSANIVGDSLVIGNDSAASANSSVTGGATNTASGSYSFIGGGNSNSASALGSAVIGGSENVASGKYSSAVGLRAKATRQGEIAHASGSFGPTPQTPAQAQRSSFILRGNTSTANTRKLTLDGTTTSTSENTLVLPADTTWQFDIRVAAYNDTATTDLGSGWSIRGAIRRSGNTTSILGTTQSYRFSDTNFGGPQVDVAADDTTEELTITVDSKGINSAIRWVAAVDIVQVSFGTP
jgi:hypothetical protein